MKIFNRETRERGEPFGFVYPGCFAVEKLRLTIFAEMTSRDG